MTNSKYVGALKLFWDNIFRNDADDEEKNILNILARIPLFRKLTKKELMVISKIMYERSFEAGEFMFETGQPGAAMFIIISGIVKIVKKNEKSDLIELATLDAGDFLGELALLDSTPRSASALANERTVAMAIFREDLNKLLETNPILGTKIMKELAITIGLRLKATNDLLLKKDSE